MQTLETLTKKIRTADDLLSVVKTMKSLAAVNIRQFEAAARSLDAYNLVVEHAWQALFRFHGGFEPERPGTRGVALVVGSDQGMCGQFNEAVIEHVRETLPAIQAEGLTLRYWTSGERVLAGMDDAGFKVARHFRLPGAVGAIGEQVGNVATTFDEYRREQAGSEHLYIFFNRVTRKGSFEPTHQRLLPLDARWLAQYAHRPWPGRSVPQISPEPPRLFLHLFLEYLFVSLFRAFAQSLAGENAARLQSMQAAEKNIEELQETLQGRYRQQRQSSITEELFDVISGFEAVSEEEE